MTYRLMVRVSDPDEINDPYQEHRALTLRDAARHIYGPGTDSLADNTSWRWVIVSVMIALPDVNPNWIVRRFMRWQRRHDSTEPNGETNI